MWEEESKCRQNLMTKDKHSELPKPYIVKPDGSIIEHDYDKLKAENQKLVECLEFLKNSFWNIDEIEGLYHEQDLRLKIIRVYKKANQLLKELGEGNGR